MGNVCGEVEAQSLGLPSARVNFAICYLETFEQGLRTYSHRLHQNMWLFGAIAKQEPQKESKAAV